jgi:hypothetical protein
MKEDDMERASGACGGGESVIEGFGGEHGIKSSFGRPRYRWKNYIKNKSSTEKVLLEWIKLTKNGDIWRCSVNTVMKLRVSWNSAKFLTRSGNISFSRRTPLSGGN